MCIVNVKQVSVWYNKNFKKRICLFTCNSSYDWIGCFILKEAPEPIFKCKNKFVNTQPPNTFNILHFLSFPVFSSSWAKSQERRPDLATPVTCSFWTHAEKTKNPSPSSAVSRTPPQLFDSQVLSVSHSGGWHTQTWLCHLRSRLCQQTPAKHKHFQVPDNVWLRRSMPFREKKKNYPGNIKNRHRERVHMRQQLIRTSFRETILLTLNHFFQHR